MQASRAAAWNTQELHTWYQKHLHALKVGEHRDRIHSDGISKGVDNSTPRHYHTYLKSKYGIDTATIDINRKANSKTRQRQHRHHRHNRHNRHSNNNKNKNRSKQSKNSGKQHIRNRSKSHFTTPNKNKHSSNNCRSHSRLPQTHDVKANFNIKQRMTHVHTIHNCRVRVPLKEKERMQSINKQNMLLKTRIDNIRPSKYLAQGMMTEHWKRHSQYRNKFLSNRDKVRQYPDVLSRQKLLKSLTAIQSKSVTNIATCNQSPDKKQDQKNITYDDNENQIDQKQQRPQTSAAAEIMPSVTINSNSVLNVKYSDIMSIHKKKIKAREKRMQLQIKNQSEINQPQIVPRISKHSKNNNNKKKKTQLPVLNSPNGLKKGKSKKRISHKSKGKNMKVIESTKDIK